MSRPARLEALDTRSRNSSTMVSLEAKLAGADEEGAEHNMMCLALYLGKEE